MPYSQEDFKYLLHQFASHKYFQLNLNSTQLNLNPIIELNLVKFKHYAMYLNSIQLNQDLIQVSMQCCSHFNLI